MASAADVVMVLTALVEDPSPSVPHLDDILAAVTAHVSDVAVVTATLALLSHEADAHDSSLVPLTACVDTVVACLRVHDGDAVIVAAGLALLAALAASDANATSLPACVDTVVACLHRHDGN